ncbi:MAG TPA: Qat anti-phage system TatD family nuclease QatD [Baekduia sp.]|uniref:Qat anti-phage system TatD family nuclease QatD n=1 Tax=Baekduia sp. TaxID=2600305 RepID=UPI002BB9EA02|nr:Qat anti-phage system TatD family nuclease QatD [Baekduia sp.]HMJ35413.1 Qat anti-phage system TatD family nuclease QatD [Baekduia sp.]
MTQLPAQFVDSHCHLDRYDRPMDVIRAAEASGVVTVVVTELPSSFQRLSVMLGKRPRVRLALGCHPLRATQVTATERALFGRLIEQTDYVGEVGLDGSKHGRESLQVQRKVFDFVLNDPRTANKVLTVHSRGAEEETIERLAAAKTTAILHWYTGALKHIDAAADTGLWFSVNPAMVESQKGRKTIASLPRERVVTETDGPFATVRGVPCVPADVPPLVSALAAIWDEDVADTRDRIFRGMTTLTKLASTPPADPSSKTAPDATGHSTALTSAERDR